jgi:hypothetical protein
MSMIVSSSTFVLPGVKISAPVGKHLLCFVYRVRAHPELVRPLGHCYELAEPLPVVRKSFQSSQRHDGRQIIPSSHLGCLSSSQPAVCSTPESYQQACLRSMQRPSKRIRSEAHNQFAVFAVVRAVWLAERCDKKV